MGAVAKETKRTARAGRGKARRPRVRLDVDARRAQLVELGLTEFGSHTFEELSIDVIAQRAGISKGLLYHYFPTKKAFYVACVREAADRLLALYDGAPDDLPPLEQLAADLDLYLDYVRGHGRAYAALMRNGAGVDREVGVVIDETREELLQRLTTGMRYLLPESQLLATPLLGVALRGWIGLAEITSIAWVEASVAAPEAPAPTKAEVRGILVRALVAIVSGALEARDPPRELAE